jgi:hypothetical protein
MKIDGACHCGYIRVEGEADPEKTTVCHCTDCQVGTGSAFRVNVPVPGATFRITGQPATYLKTTAESGNPRLQAFCPRCGSPIFSTSPGQGQQASYMVRVGILHQRRDFVPRRQNWFRSVLPWVSSLAACTGTRSKRSSCHRICREETPAARAIPDADAARYHFERQGLRGEIAPINALIRVLTLVYGAQPNNLRPAVCRKNW